jgi:hypothetical protein
MSGGLRRAAVVAPLAATALALGLGTGTAGAADLSRTDTFTFTNSSGSRVTCTVVSTQDLADDGTLTVSTTLSGPADCTASYMDVAAVYHRRSDGQQDSAFREGRGTSISLSVDDVGTPVSSQHVVYLQTCGCQYLYELRQPK